MTERDHLSNLIRNRRDLGDDDSVIRSLRLLYPPALRLSFFRLFPAVGLSPETIYPANVNKGDKMKRSPPHTCFWNKLQFHISYHKAIHDVKLCALDLLNVTGPFLFVTPRELKSPWSPKNCPKCFKICSFFFGKCHILFIYT